jgi:hypothetical protein
MRRVEQHVGAAVTGEVGDPERPTIVDGVPEPGGVADQRPA